jgi:SAM-dependent methyltransferase
MLTTIRKDLTVEQIRHGYELINKYKINTSASFVIGAPGETRAQLNKTLALIDEVKPTRPSCCIFVPFPGSVFTESLIAQGQLKEFTSLESWGTFTNSEYATTHQYGEVPVKELNKIYNRYFWNFVLAFALRLRFGWIIIVGINVIKNHIRTILKKINRDLKKIMLQRFWQKLNDCTIGSDSYWTIAVQNYSIYRDTKVLIKKYIKGNVLDIGAGSLAWKKILCTAATKYISSDFSRTHKDLDLIFDVTKPFPVADNTYDSLFCHSVLEHTPEPWKSFDEFYRVLKNDVILILSVPFVFYVHGAPHDSFRFTKYGVVQLAEKAGFTVEKLVPSGGIVQFIMNIPSVVLSTLLFAVKLHYCIKPVTILLSRVSFFLDRICDRNKLFSMNIVVVLRKQML